MRQSKVKSIRLVGFERNVILGKLIPAGTGMKRYRDVKISTEVEDFTIGDEIDFDDEISFEESLDFLKSAI